MVIRYLEHLVLFEGIKTFSLLHPDSFLPIAFDTDLFPETSLDWAGENQWFPTFLCSLCFSSWREEGVPGKGLEHRNSVPALLCLAGEFGRNTQHF